MSAQTRVPAHRWGWFLDSQNFSLWRWTTAAQDKISQTQNFVWDPTNLEKRRKDGWIVVICANSSYLIIELMSLNGMIWIIIIWEGVWINQKQRNRQSYLSILNQHNHHQKYSLIVTPSTKKWRKLNNQNQNTRAWASTNYSPLTA